MKKISMILGGVVFLVMPGILLAEQVSPNPNPLGNTITVTAPDASNYENFINYGSIETIDSGILSNYSGGTLNNYGSMGYFLCLKLNNYTGGTINNYNSMVVYEPDSIVNNYSGGVFNNYKDIYVGISTFHNYGTFTNHSDGNIALMDDSGYFGNTGTIFNNGQIYGDGYLVNKGTLNNTNTGNIDMADFPNYTGSVVNNDGYIQVGAYGFRNSGMLNNNLGGIFVSTDALGNSGELNNKGVLISYTTSQWGGLSNSGTLNNYAGAMLYNYDMLTNSGTLINNGTITEHPYDGSTYNQTSGQTINNGILTQTTINILGGSLSGTGIINGDLTIGAGGTVAPGNSVGTLTTNGTFTSSGNFLFEIAGYKPGLYDVLQINGDAVFAGGDIQFDFIGRYHPSAGKSWDFFFAGSITGWDTLDFTVSGLPKGLEWYIEHGDTYGRLSIKPHKQHFKAALESGTMLFTRSASPVPEPSTMLLLGSGLFGLVGYGRRMMKKKSNQWN